MIFDSLEVFVDTYANGYHHALCLRARVMQENSENVVYGRDILRSPKPWREGDNINPFLYKLQAKLQGKTSKVVFVFSPELKREPVTISLCRSPL